MAHLKDKTGNTFGRLTVLRRGPNKGKTTKWICLCTCGTEATVPTTSLRIGKQISCGCRRREVSAELCAQLSFSHGASRSRLYRIWGNMRYRCSNKKAKVYADYGGRGITVCAAWASFPEFQKWALANGYQDTLTLDREDNDGSYEPGNCRWADMMVQSNNKRTSRFITHEGETKTATQWARSLGLTRATVFSRIRQGFSTENVLRKTKYRATPPTTGTNK